MSLCIKFYCRECKAGKKDGLAPVEVSVIWEGKRSILTLPRKENPKTFQKETSCKRDTDIKKYLDSIKKNIDNAVADMVSNGNGIDMDLLKRSVRNGGVMVWSVKDVMNEFLSIQRKRVGVSCGAGQMRKYELAFERLGENLDLSKPIGNVKRGEIENHIAVLSKTMKPATVATEVVRLRALFKYARDCGYCPTNPFAMVRVVKGAPREEWLTDMELDKIRCLEGLSEQVEQSRRMFLLQCSTGLSYADMMRLKPEEIVCENGVYSVTKTRTKTGVRYTSVVLPEGVQILKEWGFVIPRKSVDKYNLGLLKIETLLGLSKHLHSHLGRKVYGTTLLRGGVSMKAVSKALGHSTTAITESTYAFLQSQDVINEITKQLNIAQ